MLDAAGEVIYIGKAKNLKKRVSSYFSRQLDNKTLQLVSQIHSIEVTVTRNEREALLLESNLIKANQPRYNVIFKDDKSYPYLRLTINDTYPRLSFYRGGRKEPGLYYGPYPSAREARDALNLLQSIFRLRQCDDTFFKNRKRPCLQYQIKRCTAPCVKYISPEDYQKDVAMARLFLEGKSNLIIEQLIQKMENASVSHAFEEAARIRDQISLLTSIQERQIIVGEMRDVDVLGFAEMDEEACIHQLIVREGRILGSRQYFPNKSAVITIEENLEQSMLEAFILQHYEIRNEVNNGIFIPKIILLSAVLTEKIALEDLLSEKAGHRVELIKPLRGDRVRWVEMAVSSAKHALISRSAQKIDLSPRFQALQESLQLDAIPERLECFDVSHTLGEATVASCVVFDREGPLKSDYRRFNIRAETKGDDYAALKEGLTRHYTRLKSEGGTLPDILIVDGGKGQMTQARQVLEELQVAGVTLLAVAKGPQRKAGLETVFLSTNGQAKKLELSEKALLLIQQIRDEAHRFAISAHRKARAKRRKVSSLEDISGIGNKRRIKLLQYFGGLQEILQANVDTLAKVPGINRALAERLYEALHGK